MRPSTEQYVPGVCNIGPDERAQRLRSGVISAIVTLILLIVIVAIHAPLPWRWVLILPASAAATGFLQNAFHFCVGFGMKGLYNVSHSLGKTDNVAQEEFRREDKRKALKIILLSLAMGLIIASLSML